MSNVIDTIRAAVTEAGAESILITNAPNIRFASQFSTPEDASVIITPSRAVLLTDSRYTVQADEESSIEVFITREHDAAAVEIAAGTKLAVEAESISVARFNALEKAFGDTLVPLEHTILPLRVVKSKEEIAFIRKAAEIADHAFEQTVKMMKPGVSEVEVALTLEREMRLAGAEGTAFNTIVASGPRGAMPHGVASIKLLAAGELVTLDFGAVYNGYHSDMTRTVAIGEIGAEERRLFDAVLEAQIAAVAAVRPGATGVEIDAVARDILTGHGLGEAFVHSLGHGVGLQIHELPRLSQTSPDVLAPGMLVTIEPGVYIPGFTGLRIEDLVLVTEDGHEILSHAPKAFRQL